MLKPLADYVVIQVIEQEERTASGLYLPDTAKKEKPSSGFVLAVGPGKVYDGGIRVPVDVKVGNQVFFAKYSGQNVTLDGKEYLLISERDIYAVVEK